MHGEYRERIDAATGDEQELLDLSFELGIDDEIDPDYATDFERRIGAALTDVRSQRLPSALRWCEYCGGVRDRTPGGRRSVCLCQGIACRHCGAGRIRRPISDYYDPDSRTVRHVSHVGGYLPCRWCTELARELVPWANGWPPVGESPELAAVLAPVRAAAHALQQPAIGLGEDLPPHDLVALHGDVGDWHALRLGAPPDERPLFVGRSLEAVELAPAARRLRVATWAAEEGGDVEATLRHLLNRWQPPLNRDIGTPWNGARCPSCGAGDTVPMVYGLPASEALDAAERGEIELGGCMVTSDSPARRCRRCGTAFGRKEGDR